MPTKLPSIQRTTLLLFLAVSALLLPINYSSADNESVTLVVGGKPAPFEVPPYVTSTGTVMAPADFVRLLGADYVVRPDGDLTVTSAVGRTFTQTCERQQDRLMVPLLSTAEELGAATTWSPSTNTVTLKAKLEMARVADNSVLIATSYPIYYKTQTLSAPARLVVDIYGADLDSPAASIPSDNVDISRIRTGQLDQDTVRLVFDLNRPMHFAVASSLQTNEIQLALNTKQTDTSPIPSIEVQAAANTALPAAPPVLNTTASATSPDNSNLIPLPPIPGGSLPSDQLGTQAGATKIVDVQYNNVSPNIYQIVVTTSGPVNLASQAYHAFFLSNPNRLAFDVANSAISITDAALNALSSIVPTDNNPLLRDIRWGLISAPTSQNARIVVDLLKPVVYTVSTVNLPDNSGVQYTIEIQESAAESFGNSIAGKIIIVDPGHGGQDSGAPGAGGIYEKNFTLAIGKQVRDALLTAGATPIMTRSDDTFIPLPDRSQLGIDNHADFFISIHCDSSGEQNSHSGDTVYYHGDNSICRDLARSIANRLSQLDISIQPDGIKSDYVRFPGYGFSVLRRSPEPAVLVECGYVNDDGDAKCLEDPAAQKELAEAIVAGLRDYVANR